MGSKIFDVFENFFTSYLRERNLEKVLALVSDDIVSLGTGVQEVAVGKKAFTELFAAEFNSTPGPFDFELCGFKEFRQSPDSFICFSSVKIIIPPAVEKDGRRMQPEETFPGRFTGSCVLSGGSWKITSLHLSLPAYEQAEDSFLPDLHYKRSFAGQETRKAGHALTAVMPQILPGGIIGAYAEKGLPFYIVNDEILRYMDFTYEEFINATGGMIVNIIHPDDRKMVERMILSSLETSGEYELQFRLMQKGASFIWIYAKGKVINSLENRPVFISVMMNISKMVFFQEQLIQEASRDVLTPLLNRKAAIKLIETSFSQHKKGFLFIIDMDNFKKLNDTLGHQVGDVVLKDVANLLLNYTSTSDVVARLGGDEFIVYYPGLVSPEIASARAEKLQNEFKLISEKKYPSVNLSLSIGAAYRTEGMNFDKIYSNADQALYKVKYSGKKSYCLYSENIFSDTGFFPGREDERTDFLEDA